MGAAHDPSKHLQDDQVVQRSSCTRTGFELQTLQEEGCFSSWHNVVQTVWLELKK